MYYADTSDDPQGQRHNCLNEVIDGNMDDFIC